MNCGNESVCQRIKTIVYEANNYVDLIYSAPCIHTRNMLMYQLKTKLNEIDFLTNMLCCDVKQGSVSSVALQLQNQQNEQYKYNQQNEQYHQNEPYQQNEQYQQNEPYKQKWQNQQKGQNQYNEHNQHFGHNQHNEENKQTQQNKQNSQNKQSIQNKQNKQNKQNNKNEENKQNSKNVQDKQKSQNEIEFTIQELARFNGKNGNPAYVAVNNIVYDVTNNAAWAAASHFGLVAGKDLTSEFASCHAGQTILSKLKVIGKLI